MRRGIAGVAGLGACAALALPAVATASATVTPAQATDALDAAVTALGGEGAEAGEPTLDLLELAQALPALEGRERRQAQTILARPPASGADAGGVEGFGAEWSPAATASREHFDSSGGSFRVHWVEVGEHAPDLADDSPPNGVPDYVERLAAFADESELVQNMSLSWPEPTSDGTRGGGDGLTDVYLSNVGRVGAFGYAAVDDRSGDCNGPPFQCFAYLVLDNDYAEFTPTDPDVALQATMAHEYNHVLQFGIDANQELWMLEATATWMEEQVFPEAGDWVDTYVPIWAASSEDPITRDAGGGGLRFYGTAVWNHWLDRGDSGFGPDVILDAWLASRDTDPTEYAIGAYDLAIRQDGGEGFAQEFARFTAATSEWRTGDGGFPDAGQLTDVSRRGTLVNGARRTKRVILDHTAYRLLDVDARAAEEIKLKVRAEKGVRTGIALVGRAGSKAGAGPVERRVEYMPRGRRGSVRLDGVQGFDRITAVVTNADGRLRAGSRAYRRDNAAFKVRVASG